MNTNNTLNRLSEIATRIKELRQIMGYSVYFMAEKTEIPQEDKLLDKANRHARYYRKSSFLRYLVDAFKESAFMHFIKKFIRYLKRFQLVQTAIPILLAVGAVVTVAVVSPLAVLILCAAIILPTAFVLLCFHRANRLFRKTLTGCRVRILIPSGKEALAPGSFFIRNALDMAAEDKVTVIVVTPRPVSNRGLGGRGAFFTARKEAPTLFLVRRHYFFTFRRKVLDRLDGEVTMIF